MKAVAWSWLALLALPGCLLIQPLDDAKPESTGGNNGKAGQHASGGGPSAGGAGNQAGSGSGARAGSGPTPSGGAPNGGADNGGGGVDFSLFLGEWTMTSGEYSRLCDGETTPTTGTLTPGEVDTFVLGTQASQSDLIFDLEGTDVCDIAANVDDRKAYGTGEQSCTVDEADGTKTYLGYNYFEFAVSGDGQSALSNWDVTSLNDGDLISCETQISGRYQRTKPNN